MGLQTLKTGQYTGKGHPLDELIVGEHGGGASGTGAHYFMPALPYGQLKHWIGFQEDASYLAANWTETKENSGTVAMSADGLLFTTGGSDGNSCNIQVIRAYTPAANKRLIAFTKLSLGDVVNTGFVFGFHNTDSDYFSTEPTHQAVFFKDKGVATMVGRTKDGTTGSSTGTLATLVNDTVVELAVLVNGTASVQFFYKLASAAAWTPTTKITNLPTSALRLTLNLENNEGAANTMLVRYRGFWGEI